MMHILAATLLVAVSQAVASQSCAGFSPNPIPISQLANHFPPQKVANVEALLETEAIRQTLSLYAYVIDARDFDSLSDVFTTDAIANYSAPLGVLNGIESITTTLSASLAQFPGTQHLLGSQTIRLCNKTEAISATYLRAAHFLQRNVTGGVLDVADYSSMLYAYGQYQDSWVKRDGLWKIKYRNLVYMGPLITHLS
ncbi:uncharacterized protein EKO05_0007089 [Ascochyta rabiei]|uniref:uncharacterized protein n=1 Tax=Didymella rabiei TaxID=5454 RepID=UPI0018FFF489|nr:uncharacterized protein EKO05_0007089 [Ascochyta rabiei]UPX16701.1 hypothetical protein EKO05_0007089 [Ascochyta rabiei]